MGFNRRQGDVMRLRRAWNRFNRLQRIVLSCIAGAVLLIALFPKSSPAKAIVAYGSWASLVSGILWGGTFWTKARVAIGGLRFRYLVVRRNAAAVALIGLSLLLSRAVSIGLRNPSPPSSISAAVSETQTMTEPRPTDAELKAPPTDDEIARARAAFCQAAHDHSAGLRDRDRTLFEAAERIYENSTRNKLERYRAPMVIDKVGDALLLDGWSPNSCS